MYILHVGLMIFRNLLAVRFLSDTPTEGERKIADILRQKFPGAKNVEVSDISGGCGAMYEVLVEAEEFRGKRTVLQHKMINEYQVLFIVNLVLLSLKFYLKNLYGLMRR
ncbi:hypothetical protein ACJMK2_010023 [Sinanodonta woodiana]|uniref:BolA-like protein 3 n=1 Tax=Sinanodonta woodiana TaxID=1069815 RepID=A0ABD3VFK5_SINWO